MQSVPVLAPFRFRSLGPQLSGWKRTKTVSISSRFVTKVQLIRQYARKFRFPAWAGENWDSFEECLKSFSGSASISKVRICHTDCPLVNHPSDLRVYCEILHDLVTIPGNSEIQFEVFFRESDREILSGILSNPYV